MCHAVLRQNDPGNPKPPVQREPAAQAACAPPERCPAPTAPRTPCPYPHQRRPAPARQGMSGRSGGFWWLEADPESMHGACGSLQTCTKLQCCEARRASDMCVHASRVSQAPLPASASAPEPAWSALGHVSHVAWPAVQLAYMHMRRCCSLFLRRHLTSTDTCAWRPWPTCSADRAGFRSRLVLHD